MWHEWIGYVSLAAVGLRLAWGWTGPRHARFSAFVRSPSEALRYLRRVLTGSEPRHLGHNPLGGWMVVALHVTGVVVTSVRHRENLAGAMVHGRKRPPEGADRV